jgi:hypothetical protein
MEKCKCKAIYKMELTLEGKFYKGSTCQCCKKGQVKPLQGKDITIEIGADNYLE